MSRYHPRLSQRQSLTLGILSVTIDTFLTAISGTVMMTLQFDVSYYCAVFTLTDTDSRKIEVMYEKSLCDRSV